MISRINLALLLLHTVILGALWFQLTPRKVYVEKNPAIFESDPGAWRLTLYGKDRAAVTPQPGKCLFAEDVQAGNFIWRPCKP